MDSAEEALTRAAQVNQLYQESRNKPLQSMTCGELADYYNQFPRDTEAAIELGGQLFAIKSVSESQDKRVLQRWACVNVRLDA